MPLYAPDYVGTKALVIPSGADGRLFRIGFPGSGTLKGLAVKQAPTPAPDPNPDGLPDGGPSVGFAVRVFRAPAGAYNEVYDAVTGDLVTDRTATIAHGPTEIYRIAPAASAVAGAACEVVSSDEGYAYTTVRYGRNQLLGQHIYVEIDLDASQVADTAWEVSLRGECA